MTILNREDLRDLVVPSVPQAIAVLILAILAMICASADQLFSPLAKYIPAADIRQGLSAVLHQAAKLSGANEIVLILFWAVVGLMVYAISWAVFNALVHGYNEAVIDTQFTNRGSSLEQLSPALLQLFFGVAAVVFTIISSWLIADATQTFSLSLIGWQPAHLVTEVLWTLALAVDIYVWWTLVRLTFYVD